MREVGRKVGEHDWIVIHAILIGKGSQRYEVEDGQHLQGRFEGVKSLPTGLINTGKRLPLHKKVSRLLFRLSRTEGM
ncbi:MAG: hypothetical protein ACTSVF_03655, partial [Candidatus Asgardarchaeia archaeon]